MKLVTENFIGFGTSGKGETTFKGFNPTTNEYLPERFIRTTGEELEKALTLASGAFLEYRDMPYDKRAQFLDSIADEILNLGDSLIERCMLESGLPEARIIGERGRTCNQLRLFAQVLRDGTWVDARIDRPEPNRKPIPKPDIRRILVPIGPVAVFGASNFPLAFSTAGGDTASALASGCPVVVKAHSSHPGTNSMVSSAIVKAAQKTGMPEGVFSSLYLTHEDSLKLVEHLQIKAVGFTGSQGVGMKLFNAAVNRESPIPVYAEMSSINPVVLMEHALRTNKVEIIKALTASINLGVGQFCTNPGLVILTRSEATEIFLEDFVVEFRKTVPGTMLNKSIHKACVNGIENFRQDKNIKFLAESKQLPKVEKTEGQPVIFSIDAADFLSNKVLSEEVFGPVSLFVLCQDLNEKLAVLESLEGQLTATLHATEEDKKHIGPIIDVMAQKAGRILYGGYPTGVEVCHSMQHGGPFPATTNANSTSVGTAAILRFVRPIAYQDFPDDFLPEALKNDNPLGITRLIDGTLTQKALT